MAVNISTRQIAAATLLGLTADLLAKHAVDPAMLCLEITESTLLWDVDAASPPSPRCATSASSWPSTTSAPGYSSLGYLKHLPVDYLKIDRTFVRDMLTDPDDAVIVKAVIDLGSALGLDLVAEGVETLEQAEGLTALGCHLGQGYLWRRAGEPWRALALADLANHGRTWHLTHRAPVRQAPTTCPRAATTAAPPPTLVAATSRRVGACASTSGGGALSTAPRTLTPRTAWSGRWRTWSRPSARPSGHHPALRKTAGKSPPCPPATDRRTSSCRPSIPGSPTSNTATS
jgi:EAL domain-containing protein (putative c-di-GMP-specific phosphodiesterase class I)